MPNIVKFPILPICPKCRRLVREATRTTDASGKVMHEECYRFELEELTVVSKLLDDGH